MTTAVSRILGPNGSPLPATTRPRPELASAMLHTRRQNRPSIEARYDAASSSTEFANYWANADALDADSANSKGVRTTLVKRSRYEAANNGYVDGILQTLATDIISVGPKLRLRTKNKAFNQAVETVWNQWATRVQLRRKLWCMAHAKVQDGEAFGILKTNPKVRHPVKLDIVLVETEQVTSPYGSLVKEGHIDGLTFDEFGNPDVYEVLKYHPGGQFSGYRSGDHERVPAKYMLHWFLMRRPGQHRGVPELRSTLQVGAASRRWREATVAAAETAADIAVWMSTTQLADSTADELRPMDSLPWEKRQAIAAPMGWEPTQMKAEHPNATYEAFNKAQISELGRPKGMPYNKAACDNTGNSFSGGKLDQLTYYAMLDVEREDCSDTVLDKVFDLVWEEAVLAYGWNADPAEAPLHTWDFPKHPVADAVSESQANDINLRNGSLSLSQLYSENGQDFEDELSQEAEDYGVSEDEMRKIHRNALFNDKNQQASMEQAANQSAQRVAPQFNEVPDA